MRRPGARDVEDSLRAGLRELRVPGEERAQARAWAVLSAAHAERELVPGTRLTYRRRTRLALASALAALLALGLALTPAGAQVRQWIGDAIAPGREEAKPALTRLPAPGELLVTAPAGAWIVHQDGSRRRLGDYRQAAWSPRGIYVAATGARELSAIDPVGRVRWSVARPRTEDPAWSPRDGYRVAYRSAGSLRVIWGDGTNDAALGRAAPVTPAWQPRTDHRHVLAYVDRRLRLRIADADSGRTLHRGSPLTAPVQLDWSADGDELLVLSAHSIAVFGQRGQPLWRRELPRGKTALAASFRPGSDEIALIRRSAGEPLRSEVIRLLPAGSRVIEQRLFGGSGKLQGLAYSPNGKRLLVGWRDADQWIFLPSDGTGEVQTVGDIASQFDSGRKRAGFPEIEGWCCAGGDS